MTDLRVLRGPNGLTQRRPSNAVAAQIPCAPATVTQDESVDHTALGGNISNLTGGGLTRYNSLTLRAPTVPRHLATAAPDELGQPRMSHARSPVVFRPAR